MISGVGGTGSIGFGGVMRIAGRGSRRGVAAVFALAVLAACSKSAPPVVADARPVPVRLVAAAPAGSDTQMAVSGTVRLKRETALAFNTAGRIAAVLVREGDAVAKGQMLARLDPTGLDAAQSSAKAEAARADADYRRLQTLFNKGWVTAQRLEAARSAAAAADARVKQTGFDVGLSVIRAPASGTVLRRPAEPGQIVAPGATVLIIGEADSGHVLRLPMADADLGRIAVGQLASVVVPAVGAAPMSARISEIGARGDDGSGTFRVELALPPQPGLKSGMIGKAMLRLPSAATAATGAVTVPATAVFSARADEGFVYVHDAATGSVRLRQVSLGGVDDDAVTVTGGLKPGEVVVTSGPDRLRDGSKVFVPAPAQKG
jgi:RND family efflux transporter MFP subunit